MSRTAYAIGLLTLTVLAGAILLWPRQEEAPPASRSAVQAPLAGEERPLRPVGSEEGLPPPSFDIVRIEPTGLGAASGRAAAGSHVLLKADATTLAEAEADSRGEWALLIPRPLAPGDHALRLLAALPDGRGMASEELVVVSLPQQRLARPLVVLMKPGEASQVMQNPGGFPARALALETMDWCEGTLRLGGRAEPGTALNLYLDSRFLGEARADGGGRWSLELSGGVRAEGRHRIRLDALAEDEFGARRVAFRLEVPFEAAAPQKKAASLHIESAGEGWRIEGERLSTLVYGVKAGRPLDPAVTLPGQVMAPPEPDTAMPAGR